MAEAATGSGVGSKGQAALGHLQLKLMAFRAQEPSQCLNLLSTHCAPWAQVY